MKKLLKIFSLSLALLTLFSCFSSASSCKDITVGNNNICVSIDKGSNHKYTVNSDINCNGSCAVSCSILLPDNSLASVGMCNGSFYYDSNSSKKIKLYITINDEYKAIESYYDFGDGSWGSNGGGSSSYDNDELELSANKTNPSTSEYIKLTIDTDEDYVGKITFYKVQYRSSTSSSWTTISSRTNSTYFSNYSSEWENGYYKMKSSDEGHKIITNFLKFAKKGYYRIYAEDINNNTSYIEFNVGGSSSTSNDEIELSANTNNPSTSEYIKLTINTDEDYVGKITFYKVQYRSSTSSSRTTISSRTNSTYFSNYSDEREDGYYKMKSSDDGEKTINNFLKFAKKGYYRIYAQDVDGNYDYIDFNVGGSSSTSNDEIELSANKNNPSTSEYIKLTINTDEDYVGKITFYKVQYRSSTSSSWTTISSRTNSTYFSNYSDEREDGYYRMTSYDEGEKTINNFLKFAKKGYYRIYAEDTNDNTTYIDFNVGGSSSTSNDEIELTTNKTNPTTSEYIKLTINTDEDYIGKITFYKVQYRSSTSSSWTTISSRTNSTYFSNYSDEWENGYYRMTSYDEGEKTINNFLKFAKKGYYRIYAEDINDNTTYIDFNVGGSSTSNDEIELSANKSNPSTSEWIRLTIETNKNYVGKITFYKVQYKSSSSSSRTTISSRTNSTYFSNYSDEWENGYYRMTSYDEGEKTINNFLKFAKKGYYRIYAEDTNNNTTYIEFNVGGSSSTSNTIELETDDETPSANEYVDLTILTNSSYRGDINFSAKYKSSTSNSWTSISTTSSSYFINRSTTWNRGYITMTSSDGGEKTISNIFKFAKKGYYRIIAEDDNGKTAHIDFNVGNPEESTLDGFTQKEFEMVERIYNTWPTLMSKLRTEYPKLKNNTTWKNLSDELYKNMGDVVNKKSNRKFKDYDDFDDDFRYRFTYTQRRMD